MTFMAEAHLDLEALAGPNPSVDFMEVGLINYYWARSEGIAVNALPVFLRAAFRHSYIFVNANAGIVAPKDLEGKRVGTRYGMTANVWARALLQHQYGVALEKIQWLNQETRAPGPYQLPAGLTLEPVAREVNLQDWLVDGTIDALVHPDLIPTKLLARGKVRRLFANAAAESHAYYTSTGVVPVMNTIAFRTSEPPETIAAVLDALRRAKALGLDAMQDVRSSGLLWQQETLEEQLCADGTGSGAVFRRRYEDDARGIDRARTRTGRICEAARASGFVLGGHEAIGSIRAPKAGTAGRGSDQICSEYHYFKRRLLDMDKTISAADANRTFSRVLQAVREGGSYTVTAHGKPIAKIIPIAEDGANGSGARDVLLARLRSQRVTRIGRWSRDELYDAR